MYTCPFGYQLPHLFRPSFDLDPLGSSYSKNAPSPLPPPHRTLLQPPLCLSAQSCGFPLKEPAPPQAHQAGLLRRGAGPQASQMTDGSVFSLPDVFPTFWVTTSLGCFFLSVWIQ